MAGRNGWTRGAGLPVFLSLAMHGLFLAALCLIPTTAETSTPLPVETCVFLSLDSEPEVRTATVLAPLVGGSGEEAEAVAVVEPLPRRTPSAEENRPSILTVVATTSGAREPTGANGPPGTGVSGLPGAGRGMGSGVVRPALFGPVAPGQRVVYLLDSSTSMGFHHALDHARQELLASLARLPATARFQVIAYNRGAEPIYLDNRVSWLDAGAETLARVEYVLAKLAPSGSTDHERALCRALALRPHLIYLVTDAVDLTAKEIQAVTRFNKNGAIIHAIELSGRRGLRADHPLRQLALANRGTYRQVVLAE